MATAAALVVALGLLGLVHTSGHWLRPAWMTPLLWLLPLFWLTWRCRPPPDAKGNVAGSRRALPLLILSVGLFISLFSSAVEFRWFFFVRWLSPGAGFWDGDLNRAVLLTALLVPFCVSGRLKASWLLFVVFLVVEGLCWKSFMGFTGGQALYRDDHASMMFRLWEFTRTFPRIFNYVPFWNGGVSDHAILASGIGGPGLVFLPVLKAFPIEQVYGPMLAILFLLALPAIGVGSLRLLGANWTAAWCAGILLLGVSRLYFLWLLHYGTVGACFSAFFILPFSACVFRVLWLNRCSWRLGVLLIGSCLLLIAWPQQILTAAVVAAGVLFNAGRWTRRKLGFLALCALGVLVLYGQQIVVLLFQSGDVFQHVLKGSPDPAGSGAAGFSFSTTFIREGGERLKYLLMEVNPLIVFLGLGGVWFLPYRSVRRWLAPLLLVLGLLAGWGSVWKPNLQLHRIAIPLAMLGVIPASLAAAKFLNTRSPALALLRAGLLALLLVTGWTVAQLMGGAVVPNTRASS
ncbi:MAG: hypothetical protein HY343_07280, partial [Lentisphaerae bacterium]|nr:hypothetical protein [Lentisphaerota bacterium]